MPTLLQLKTEAILIRGLIKKCDMENTQLITDDFPVMNCKISSMLLSYHFLTLWPEIQVTGIGGIAKDKVREPTISHYWLEVEEIAIDITGDQYNIISPNELNRSIITRRPFSPVHVEHKETSFLYKLFNHSYRDDYVRGFPSVEEDFLHKMESDYRQLLKNKGT